MRTIQRLLKIAVLACLGVSIAATAKAWVLWNDAGEIVHSTRAYEAGAAPTILTDSETLVVLARFGDVTGAAEAARLSMISNAAAKSAEGREMDRKIITRLADHRLRRRVSDESCIKAYLDTADYGGGDQGLAAAIQSLFPGETGALTLEQAATLAALLHSPGLRDKPDALQEQADTMMARLQERIS